MHCEEKKSMLVGADLSLLMIEFAKEHSPFEDIPFIIRDATKLVDLQDDSSDCVVASLIIHQLHAKARQHIEKEA
jgi:ubiquinone/menaquinone biosynthesis C-methylase UbiE